jgi:hypothetical protein
MKFDQPTRFRNSIVICKPASCKLKVIIHQSLSITAQTVEIAPLSRGQFENLRRYASGVDILEIIDIQNNVREFELF